MKTATHSFNTVHGLVNVQVDIFRIDAVEAIDVYEQDAAKFSLGGWRIEGMINGTPRGMHFYGNNEIAPAYFGDGTEEAARAFLAEAHQDGFFGAALKPLTDDGIAQACDIHGAKAVSDAAFRRMNGDHAALPKLGLEDPATLGDANRITAICYKLMSPEDKAMDLAQASIDLAKIEPKS